ncbi:putative ribonuclease H-like domain-containing protein [Tanacetum coccineum]
MYSFNLENIVPSRGLACLIAKATVNESNEWHRRLGHVIFKNLNKLVKGNLVFSNMSRKGVKFSGKVTPLFDSMLVPYQEPEVEDSRDSLEGTNRSEGDQELSVLCTNLSNKVLALEASKDAQAAEIINLKARIKKMEKKSHPVISHHKAWLMSVSRLSKKRKLGRKESVSKQGRKNAKLGPTLDDSTFDNLDANHGMDYMDTEELVNEGRLSKETKELNVTHDTKVLEKGGSNEETVSTGVPEVSSATPITPPTTTSVFEDEDIFLADALEMLSDKTKLKGVAIKEVKESDRPKRSILTLKPLPSIDPKDKGKWVLKESPVKKVKRSDLDAAQIAKDAEVARLVYEEELAELEMEKEERQRQEQAFVDYIANLYDEVQAKIDASEELAARLQMEERGMYTVEERSRLLAKYFENRKKQLAAKRSAAMRNKPPTITQLKSLMMTYLKHTGRYKHARLNKKTLEEIQALYIKEQERAVDFVPIGSEKDERMIEKMNKKIAGVDEEEVLEEPDSTKVEVKQEGNTESTRKRPGRRLKMKATKKSKRQKTNPDLEVEEQLKAFLMIVPDEEGEIDYEVLDIRYPIVDWESKFYHTDRYGKPHDYYRVFRADGSSRYIKTFTEMVLRRYPLTKETLERMLTLRLIAESESEAVFDLLRFIQKQIDESRSHDGICQKLYGNQLTMLHSKELASPKQTALGKDISNPLIVDSLLKTIWLSMHHVIAIKHWLFQSKRLLGRIVGFQKFLQLSAATYTSYYCQFYLVLLVKNAKDSRK